jgi:hypothetical protein
MAGRALRWLTVDGQACDEQVLAGYDIVVLDPSFRGSVAAVASDGALVCGYLSVGEIRTSDPFFARLDGAALLEANPSWPGTLRIDVRHESWTRLVLDEIIPSIADKGFAGLVLDTLDTPPYLEQLDPAVNRGMGEAAAAAVRAISDRYPEMFLGINRGYALLPRIADRLDAVIAESLLTSPDEAGRGCKWNDQPQVDLQLALLGPARDRRPPMPVLSLDYWDPAEPATIAAIYRSERALGHHPYVGMRALDGVVPEPG